MELREFLRAARKRANLSQDDLAGALGIEKPAISKWENGKGMPRLDRVPHIARVLRISADDLRSHMEDFENKRSNTGAPPTAKPDTFVQLVDPQKSLIHTAEAQRDVPQFGINPRSGEGDFEMGVESGAFVRRPATLRGRSDIRALRAKSGDLLFLEPERVRPPSQGDDVVVVLKGSGEWAPAYLRRLKSIDDDSVHLERSGVSDPVVVPLGRVDMIYRVLSMADLFG